MCQLQIAEQLVEADNVAYAVASVPLGKPRSTTFQEVCSCRGGMNQRLSIFFSMICEVLLVDNVVSGDGATL
jgi:hypothetical protein